MTLVILVIIVHHFLYDRHPDAVPPYVRAAIQFDSGDEEEDSGGGGGTGSRHRLKKKDQQDNIIEVGDGL